MNSVSPTSQIGTADSHRRSRLLDLAELLSRSDGGTCRLSWPSQADELHADARRDLEFTGDPEKRMLTFGQQIRRHSAIARAGATFISLPTNQESSLPSIDRSKKAVWTGTAANVAPTLDLTSSTPKRLSAYLTASKQLLKTSPILAAGFLEAQLLSAIGAAIDDAAINGTGTTDPFGLLADPNLIEETFSGSITVADVIAMEKAIADAHGEHDPEALGWLADPATRATLRALPRMTSGTHPLWPDSGATGPLGRNATVSPFAPASTLIFGNFGDLLVLQSESIEILANPYSLDTTGFIRLGIHGYFDIVALNPEHSFVRAVPA